MSLIKAITGHSRSMAKIQSYLEGPSGGERYVAQDFYNIERENGPERVTWGRQMELTREACGNDRAANGRSPVTFKHYVISPDPRDNCGLETLRNLVADWVRDNFSDYEVAVTYHDDNSSRILHAHVVVNNTNLETGRRISGELTNARVRGINNSLQNLALAHGLSAFAEDHRSMTEAEMSAAGKNVSRQGDERSRSAWRDHRGPKVDRGSRRPRPARARGPRRDLSERGLEQRGETSWVGEIRDTVDVARRISRNEREFLSALDAMGVGVSESKRGDWVFQHPDGGARRVRGRRLGVEYTREALTSELSLGVTVGDSPGARRTVPQRRAVIVAVRLRRAAQRGPTAKQVVYLLDYAGRRGVRRYEDFPDNKTGRRMLELAYEIHLYDTPAPPSAATSEPATTRRRLAGTSTSSGQRPARRPGEARASEQGRDGRQR